MHDCKLAIKRGTYQNDNLEGGQGLYSTAEDGVGGWRGWILIDAYLTANHWSPRQLRSITSTVTSHWKLDGPEDVSVCSQAVRF